ncbi:MAG TPA: hypothetical protein VNW04_22075 [Puia sp.]|jgi:hypothetical protein|nr:hypothetical protein [Puia sp.]
MRTKYLLLLAISVVVLSGVVAALYLYNKPHRNVGGLSPALRISATELYGAFRKDESAANRRFGDKVIEVMGTIIVAEITDSTAALQLDTGDPGGTVSCGFTLDKGQKGIFPSKGSAVTIKGRCIGFLQDVNLVDCVLE